MIAARKFCPVKLFGPFCVHLQLAWRSVSSHAVFFLNSQPFDLKKIHQRMSRFNERKQGLSVRSSVNNVSLSPSTHWKKDALSKEVTSTRAAHRGRVASATTKAALDLARMRAAASAEEEINVEEEVIMTALPALSMSCSGGQNDLTHLTCRQRRMRLAPGLNPSDAILLR